MKSTFTLLKGATIGKRISLLLSPIISILFSMKLLILGLAILILLDLWTGIRKNLYLNGIKINLLKKAFWGAIKSYLLRRTWKKTYEYIIGIIAISVLETFILGGASVLVLGKLFSITELAIIIPALVEVWSIGENLEAVSGRNFLKKLLPLMPKPIKTLFSKKEEI